MTTEQKLLLKLDNFNMIDGRTTSDSDYRKDPLGKEVKRISIEKRHDQMIENLSSNNKAVALFSLGKIAKIIENLNKPGHTLNHFEQNLINSFFSKSHFSTDFDKLLHRDENKVDLEPDGLSPNTDADSRSKI